MVSPSAFLGRHSPFSTYRDPLIVWGAVVALVAAAVVLSRLSVVGFLSVGLALIALLGYAAHRWPRAALIVAMLSPVFDRYLVAGLLPRELETVTHLVSEGLLLVVGSVIAVDAIGRGRLLPAVRHPTAWAIVAFLAVAVVSTLVNGVPVHVAVIGVAFTIDAIAFFFLPRMIGFSMRQAVVAIGILVGVIVIAAAIVVLQGLFSPNLFGLAVVVGRFGEIHRLAAFFRDPNIFGTFVVATVPFVLLAATRLTSRRHRQIALAVAFVLLLALWLSFSRGAWLALVVGVGAVLALADRRTLLLAVLLGAVSFATAVVMPRDLLLPPNMDDGGIPGAEARPDLIDSTLGRVETIGAGRDLRTLFVLNALPILADHPVVGVGPGRYGGAVANLFPTPVYPEYETDELLLDPTQRTVDNFWLHVTVETGVLGLAALLAAAVIPGVRILRAGLTAVGLRRVLLLGIAAATAGIAVNSVTTMLLEANSIGFVFWFLLGLGTLLVPRGGLESRSEG